MVKTLIERRRNESAECYVGVYKIETEGYDPQFATWCSNLESPEDTYWGHYFNNIIEAVADYKVRLAS